MIKFLSKLPFLKEIYRQGGIDSFALAHKDILETMADDLDKRAEALAKKKLNDLLSLVDMNSVVTINKQQNKVYIGGQEIDTGRISNLKAEAESLSQFDLWHIIQETPKELAQQAMFVAGDSLDDMKKGRSMLYLLSNQRNIVNLFKDIIIK